MHDATSYTRRHLFFLIKNREFSMTHVIRLECDKYHESSFNRVKIGLGRFELLTNRALNSSTLSLKINSFLAINREFPSTLKPFFF